MGGFLGQLLGSGRVESPDRSVNPIQPPETKVIDLSDPSSAKALTWASVGDIASESGVTVNYWTALRVATAFCCARVLAEGISQIPLRLMRQVGEARTPARAHPLYKVLSRRPNPWMTSFQLRETMMYHALFTGNGYAIKNRAGPNQAVRELLPVSPGRVAPYQDVDGSVYFDVSMTSGGLRRFPATEIVHLRGPSWDGVTGLDAVILARDALGLSVALERSQEKLHANGGRPGGILSAEGKLSDEVRTKLRKQFEADHVGWQRAYKLLVLDQSMKYQTMSMSGVDSQHLETRQHQIAEICRFFRVFPHMVGQADKTATFASAEQFFIAHVVHCLGPWVERVEQTLDRDLLSEQELEDGYYCCLSVQGLMRGDSTTRGTFYKNMIIDGWGTRNEVRALEDMNPLPGLEVPLMPLNMTDGSKPPAPVPPPAPPAK